MTTELITNRQPTADELKAMGTSITIKTGDKTVTVTPEKLEQVTRTLEEKIHRDRIALSNAQEEQVKGESNYDPLDPTKTQKPTHSEWSEKNERVQPGPRRVSGEHLLNAIKHVFKACPKPKDLPEMAGVLIRHNTDKKRIELIACDGCRSHVDYVEAPEGLLLITAVLDYDSVRKAKKRLQHALDSCPSMMVEFVTTTYWEAHVLEAVPLVIELEKFSDTPYEYMPPSYSPPTGASPVVSDYSTKHVVDAMTWTGGAYLKHDRVDGAGRRHILLTDTSGEELARAVVLPVGMTEGLPDSRQTELDSTLSPPGVADSKRAKAKVAKDTTVTVETSDGQHSVVEKPAKSKSKRNKNK